MPIVSQLDFPLFSWNVFDKRTSLTNWCLEDGAVLLKIFFSNSLYIIRYYSSSLGPQKLLSGKCHRISLWEDNIGSDNGLVPSGNKVWASVNLDLWHHMAPLSHNEWSLVWKISTVDTTPFLLYIYIKIGLHSLNVFSDLKMDKIHKMIFCL